MKTQQMSGPLLDGAENSPIYIDGDVYGSIYVAGNSILGIADLITPPDIKKTIKRIPDSNGIRNLKTKIESFFQSEHWREIDEALSELVKYVPSAAFVYGVKAYALVQIRDFEGAIRDYTTALRRTPKASELYIGRGYA